MIRLILACLGTLLLSVASPVCAAAPIDRHALVSRHDLDWPSLPGLIPLGNGNFALNADGTGVETFGGNTMSHWCWHSFPMPAGTSPADVKPWAALERGRLKGVTTPPPQLKDWLYWNPAPLNLGRIGFVDALGKRIEMKDCVSTGRRLDLWTGLLTSQFTWQGVPVTVETCVARDRDRIALRISSPALADGRLRLRLDFPSPSKAGSTDPRSGPPPWAGDFSNPANQLTEIVLRGGDGLLIRRTVNATVYWVQLAGANLAPASVDPANANGIELTATGPSLDLAVSFSADRPSTQPLPRFDATRSACASSWATFWKSGGAIDLSGSRDPRWKELERRIVLSQYELSVQSAGDNFPAEVGLTGLDNWSSKFHLEMTWWHLAHYALWNRWPMAEKAMTYYPRSAPLAREIAENFDYRGLMWPKSTGPTAINDGWSYEMALMWKEPHPIFFAELEYRLHPNAATLAKWKDIVFGTAEFMADYPTRDPQTGIYSIAPCWPMCETPICQDPIFELAYWRWALLRAQEWRLRLGLPRDPHWDDVVQHLASLPVQNGLYVYRADRSDTYTRRNIDHLDPIAAFAMFSPVPGLDHETAHRTLLEIAGNWQWNSVWGWDFPLLAMGAARMDEPKIAIDALLNPSIKNEYDERGLNRFHDQMPYLPGNGGLLYATAMMAAGWDGAPRRHAPGFPDDGSWTVRWDGLNPAP